MLPECRKKTHIKLFARIVEWGAASRFPKMPRAYCPLKGMRITLWTRECSAPKEKLWITSPRIPRIEYFIQKCDGVEIIPCSRLLGILHLKGQLPFLEVSWKNMARTVLGCMCLGNALPRNIIWPISWPRAFWEPIILIPTPGFAWVLPWWATRKPWATMLFPLLMPI